MMVLQSAFEKQAEVFFTGLGAATQRALLLDYDGTLAPFREERHAAAPYPDIPELLEALRATAGTRIVVVSGRSAVEVAQLLPMDPLPEIFGVHGAERLHPDGRREAVTFTEEQLRRLVEAGELLRGEGLGDRLEEKLGAIAVHWRGLPPRMQREVAAATRRALLPLARDGFLLAPFDGGLEFRLAHPNKGDVVRALLRELPESAALAYLGDDQTDEDAFHAIRSHGLGVLVRPQWRSTFADLWLKPPDELLQFLHEWLHACGGDV